MGRRQLDMLLQILHVGMTDAHLMEQPCLEDTERRAVLGQSRTSVDRAPGHGQYPHQLGHHYVHEGEVPSRRAELHPSAQHLGLGDLAIFRSFKSCIQTQTTLTSS